MAEARGARAAERVQQRRGALEEDLDGRAEQRHAVAVQAERAAGQAQAVVQQEACRARQGIGLDYLKKIPIAQLARPWCSRKPVVYARL